MLRSLLQPVLRTPIRPPFERRGGWNPRVMGCDLWLAPDDLSTLYQDSAGTTAGAATQPVGLGLDKSQGAARGAELWTTAGVVAMNGSIAEQPDGSFNVTATAATAGIRLNVAAGTFAAGDGVEMSIQWSGNTNGRSIAMFAGGASYTASAAAVGTSRSILFATAASQSIQMFATNSVAGDTFNFRVVSVRKVPGNHVSQSTTASRPTLQLPTYYGIRSDGVDDSLSSTTGGGGTAGFLLCSAITVNGGAGTTRTLFSDAGTNTGYIVQLSSANTLGFAAGNGTAFSSVAGGAFNVGETHVLTLWDDGSNLNAQIDNGSVSSAARPVVSAGSAGFSLFKSNTAASQFMPADTFQLVYCKNTAKTAAERARLKTYIAAKVGLSL